jgi:hypothetical protein
MVAVQEQAMVANQALVAPLPRVRCAAASKILAPQGSYLTSTMGTIYTTQDTFSIPAPVSSLTLGHVGQLYAGSGELSLQQPMKEGGAD